MDFSDAKLSVAKQSGAYVFFNQVSSIDFIFFDFVYNVFMFQVSDLNGITYVFSAHFYFVFVGFEGYFSMHFILLFFATWQEFQFLIFKALLPSLNQYSHLVCFLTFLSKYEITGIGFMSDYVCTTTITFGLIMAVSFCAQCAYRHFNTECCLRTLMCRHVCI